MILRNLNKKYVVIQEYMAGNDVCQYICYEMGAPENVLYSAVCQKLSSMRNEEIGFLTEEMKHENFSDLIDFFIHGEQLVVLFQYPKGVSLKQKISSEECGIQERLEIVKSLLEQILFLNLSDYFFHAAMDIDLIHVSSDGEISFLYDCRHLNDFDDVNFQNGAKSLGEVIAFIFSEEMKQRSIPELYSLVYDLKHETIDSYIGIYEKFWQIYQIYIEKSQEDLEPYSLSFRIWDRIKDIGRFLKKLVQPALVLLALAYLVVSIIGLFAEPGIHENFKSIGTVKIENTTTEDTSSADDTQQEETGTTEEAKTEETQASGVE
ncbi:MAG: hypothetical protein ACLVEN_04110 [Anaerotignum lactatifermentans]|uniref:hypothetical protein n=1 Tax=Anaerotignum lactatifermentans TaxID=160404 RepID=UPI00399B214E